MTRTNTQGHPFSRAKAARLHWRWQRRACTCQIHRRAYAQRCIRHQVWV